MGSKPKAWFKSVFDTDPGGTLDPLATTANRKSADQHAASASGVHKSTAVTRKRAAASAVFNATGLDATIDLTAVADDDDATAAAVEIVPLRHTNITATSSWLENFAPRTVADLAIHAKKIEELQQWLLQCQQYAEQPQPQQQRRPPPMLCISGPAGAGKTATLRLLAGAAGFAVQEWVQPIDVELMAPAQLRWESSVGADNAPAFAESQTLLFEQFLFRASRYRSLFESDAERVAARCGRLVLVEDFPNVFLKDATAFEAVLEHYAEYGRSPIVFICTDSRSRHLDLAYTLFGEATRIKYGIAAIAFNAVSSTLLKRGLRRIAAVMAQPAFARHYRTVAADELDSIVLTAQGDLRNAMINMHMLAQKGGSATTTKPPATSRKGGAKKGAKLPALGCDETITMMHALGRALNPKYADDRPDRLLHSPEQLADDFCTQPQNFLNLLHANYACHFRDIETTLRASDALSGADVLLSEWRDDACGHLALTVAVRAVMAENRHPASGWLPIRGGAAARKKKAAAAGGGIVSAEEELRRLFGIGRTVSAKVMAADYRTFARVIVDERRRRPAEVGGGGASDRPTVEDDDGAAERKRMEQSIEW